MENKLKMYSNTEFARNLQTLINNSAYNVKEISEKLQTVLNISISEKQLNKYLKGMATPKADKLYALADFFCISIDSLIGRFELSSEYYIETDAPNFNKFHLDSSSRYELSKIDNETKEDVIFLASHKVQMEIDRLFRKSLTTYIKKR